MNNPDATTRNAYKVFGEDTLRFLRLLPIITGFLITLYIRKFAAHKSLKVWRALQVYDSQLPPKKGFYGLKKVGKVERFFQYFYLLVPGIIQLIVTLPIDQFIPFDWLISLRFATPYICIAILTWHTLTFLLARFNVPLTAVGRWCEEEKKTKLIKAGIVHITGTTTEKKVNRARLILGFNILFSTLLAYYCAKYASSIFILFTITLITNYLPLRGLCIPNDRKVSIRRMIPEMMIWIGLASFVILLWYGVKQIFVYICANSTNPDFNCEAEIEKMKKGSQMLVGSQIGCILYVAFWSLFMMGPANLIGLAYRYDASKLDSAEIQDRSKRLAILESRKVAKQNQLIMKLQKHPYDNLGRTPILIEANSIQLPSSFKEQNKSNYKDFPTFDATLSGLIAIQAIGLFLSTGPWPFWFNVPYFIKTEEQASLLIFTFSWNFPAFFGFFILPPIMLFSAGLTAYRRGSSFFSGVKDLWHYEENWSANYTQAIIDHEIVTEDGIELNEDENAREEDMLLAPENNEMIEGDFQA